MLNYKVIVGIIATAVGFIGYIPYFRDIFRGKTKPHAFSWSVWSLLATIAFFAQLSKGGGAGVLATALTAIGCFTIAGLAVFQKNKDITLFDYVAFAGAILGIILWIITKNPVSAVICVTIADTLGFLPSFRKAYYKPSEETPAEFIFAAAKWIISIPALAAFNPTTLIYPVTLIFTNGAFALMVLMRRRIFRTN